MTDLDPHALGLAPHPEGGWYRRIWAHEQTLSTPTGERPLATTVSFLLRPGDVSAWHKVTSPELWLWQGGGAVRLRLGGTGDTPSGDDAGTVLGPGGHFLVPGGVWQTASPVDEAVLVACVVSPGFDFADFTLHEGRG